MNVTKKAGILVGCLSSEKQDQKFKIYYVIIKKHIFSQKFLRTDQFKQNCWKVLSIITEKAQKRGRRPCPDSGYTG